MFNRIAASVCCLLLFTSYNAGAANIKKNIGRHQDSLSRSRTEVGATRKKTPPPVAQLPTRTQTSLVVDAKNGKILHAQNARERIYPASLTKVMTLYLTFEAIQANNLSLNDKIRISKKAEQVIPLKLHLKAGDHITVKEAILGTIIHSANDCSIALAEHIGGSEDKFAAVMTRRAHQLGMRSTTFKNASGLHHAEQKSTALDLAKMSMAIKRDFPRFYPLFAKTSFEFRGRTVHGHNPVVANYAGAEGLKTGFTTPAGYNLITTASRHGKSLVAVVTGTDSKQIRTKKMVQLLDTHFGALPSEKKMKKTGKTAENKYNAKKKVTRSKELYARI